MELTFNLLIFAAAGLLIMKSADLFVRGAVEIALALKLQKIFIAVVFVSLVTTLPEFIVSVSSSFIGQTGMAVGNAVGSCVCNIGLVFAVGAIISNIKVKREDLIQNTAIALFVLIFIYLISLDGVISRMEAYYMLFFMALFLYYNYVSAMYEKDKVEKDLKIEKDGKKLPQGIFLFLSGGILTIILARYGLVDTGLKIADILKIPPIVIGLTLTAFGTSIPELFTAVASSRRGHGEIVLGNVLGANILNLLWVLGFAALINPLAIDRPTLQFTLPFTIFITLVMLLLGIRGYNFDRRKGIILLGIYLLYIASLFIFIYK